jgi:hypothetical protein
MVHWYCGCPQQGAHNGRRPVEGLSDMAEPRTFYTLVRVQGGGYHFLQGYEEWSTVDVYETEDEARTAMLVLADDVEIEGGDVRVARIHVLD